MEVGGGLDGYNGLLGGIGSNKPGIGGEIGWEYVRATKGSENNNLKLGVIPAYPHHDRCLDSVSRNSPVGAHGGRNR